MTALIITFILLLVVGAPIFFAVGISASAFVLSSGSNSLAIITQKMVDGIISTTLMALPLFIYSGNLMSCGATQRLMRFADMILGKIPGGLGTAAFAQPYTMSTALERTFHIPAWVVTVAAAAICGIVLIGGVKGIGKFCEKITPAMCLIYVVGALGVIIVNIRFVPQAFAAIFKYAFAPMPAIGGLAGSASGRGPRHILQRGRLRLLPHHPRNCHHRPSVQGRHVRLVRGLCRHHYRLHHDLPCHHVLRQRHLGLRCQGRSSYHVGL